MPLAQNLGRIAQVIGPVVDVGFETVRKAGKMKAGSKEGAGTP